MATGAVPGKRRPIGLRTGPTGAPSKFWNFPPAPAKPFGTGWLWLRKFAWFQRFVQPAVQPDFWRVPRRAWRFLLTLFAGAQTGYLQIVAGFPHSFGIPSRSVVASEEYQKWKQAYSLPEKLVLKVGQLRASGSLLASNFPEH